MSTYQADLRRRRMARMTAERQQLTASLVALRHRLQEAPPVALEAKQHAHELRVISAAIEALTEPAPKRRDRWEIEADESLLELAKEELSERQTLNQALELAK